MSYQGYKNYETWAVSLWLSNDQGDYDFWLESANDIIERDGMKDSAYTLSQYMSEHFQDEHFPLDEGLYSDMLSAALQEVDWLTVAEEFIDVVKEERRGAVGS